MGAWATALDPTGSSGIRFLADPHGALTSALDLSFDSAAIFGNARSKRYALVVEDGKVVQAHVEPDNTGLNGEFRPHVSLFAFSCLGGSGRIRSLWDLGLLPLATCADAGLRLFSERR